MKNKTAILIGATGLVGSHVLKELHDNIDIGQILIFGRRSVKTKHGKVKEYIIDFDQIENYKTLIRGDVLFSCLGTTLKAAGSKENQFKVDVTYQDEFAKIAADNRIPAYYLISAPGADKKSKFFYSLTPKVEMEFEAAQNRYLGLNNTETPTPSYTLLNMGIMKEINYSKTKNIQFQFQVNNLFDVAYQSHLSRLKYFEYYAQSPDGHLGIYNMGRNVTLKAVVPF